MRNPTPHNDPEYDAMMLSLRAERQAAEEAKKPKFWEYLVVIPVCITIGGWLAGESVSSTWSAIIETFVPFL